MSNHPTSVSVAGLMRRRALRAMTIAVVAAMSLALPAATAAGGSPRTAGMGPGPLGVSAPTTLRVMTFNIFYGGDELNLGTGRWCVNPNGCQATFAKVVGAIRASGADIVGLEEGQHNTSRVAEALGWYASERLQIVSRYPLIDPPGGNGVYLFAELAPGRIVAVASVHLPAVPYGPYRVRDGMSRAKLRALEESVRLPAIQPQLAVLPALAEAGIPVFLVGDFNSPSHLDWTAEVAEVRPAVRYPFRWPVSAALEQAGFRDSYREVHLDPVAVPGFTWTPGGPESNPREVHDRIDWVLAAGPAVATESRILGELGGPDVDVPVDPFPSDHRGVVSTFAVTPGITPAFVAVESRRLSVGDELNVAFHAPGEPGEGVVLVPAGLQQDDAVAGLATGTADGELRFPTASLSPGAYEAVLVAGDGSPLARSPFWLYEAGSPTTLTTSKGTYRVGERITVSWANAPGMRWDWVAIFRPRSGRNNPYATTCSTGSCGNGGYLAYEYTHTSIEGSTSFDRDSAGAWPLAPGAYEVRYLLDDGYRLVARSARFEVAPRRR